jgi:hypothetical protein
MSVVAVETPIRTQVRDVFVDALRTIDNLPTVRVKGAEIVTQYLNVDECRKYPTYGVIVTNEAVSHGAQMHADVTMTVLIVVYVRQERDARAMLDGAIEDIWEVLRSGQLVKAVVPYLELESIDTDDGTTSAKPFAQAVLRWQAHVRRSMSW